MRKWYKYNNYIYNEDVIIYYDSIEYKDEGIVLYIGNHIVATLKGDNILMEVSGK